MYTAVFIGRFQPPHAAHIHIINKLLTAYDQVVVLLGSSNLPRTIKNPWMWQEREAMIRIGIIDMELQGKIHFQPIEDSIYSDAQWLVQVQRAVAMYQSNDNFVTLVGMEKDESSYYLKMFPQWEFESVDNIHETLHATNIREKYFTNGGEFLSLKGDELPIGVSNYLRGFLKTADYKKLCDEFAFIENYKKTWKDAPYPPIFVTVDAVVEQAGHVLVVRRRSEPGKGLLALPGGFLDHKELIEDAVIRELKEETKINVSKRGLKGSIQSSKVFDAPGRSLRGRTITHAFHFKMDAGPLKEVVAGSDASSVKWLPLGQALMMSNQFYEDHLDIIKAFMNDFDWKSQTEIDS